MNDTLSCSRCGHGWGLTITTGSHNGDRAFEVYECECGATGTLTHDEITGTALTGCLR
ncbi:hypothetical protein [Halococcus hamelinensis]|uniref:Uncharacterized protein n=1 Tax=Halococcus hamelinensis 100A6 TaxID=1132509 RepID=M0MAN6_9EURY|nr:hypothetical protein [Halococcus hamelinensis]EMA41450.1 hypothetical protein C447_01310 [Halococcus hamelinensis 100A6]